MSIQLSGIFSQIDTDSIVAQLMAVSRRPLAGLDRQRAVLTSRKIAVEDIETLRKKQLRIVQIEFSHPVKTDEIDCTGMVDPLANLNSLSFMYSGEIEGLLQSLTGKEIKDLIIEEPTLEEIFMHYYSEEKGQNKKS